MSATLRPSSSTNTRTGARSRGQSSAARMLGASLASSSAVRVRQGNLRWPAWLSDRRISAWSGGSGAKAGEVEK